MFYLMDSFLSFTYLQMNENIRWIQMQSLPSIHYNTNNRFGRAEDKYEPMWEDLNI